MNTMKTILLPIVSTLLLACSDSNNKTANTDTASPSDKEIYSNTSSAGITGGSLRTEELNPTPELSFEYSSQISINLSLNTPEKRFLKVCRVDDNKNITVDNCLVSAQLASSGYQDTLILGNEVKSLAMQVITFESPVRVEYYYWDRNKAMRWDLEI